MPQHQISDYSALRNCIYNQRSHDRHAGAWFRRSERSKTERGSSPISSGVEKLRRPVGLPLNLPRPMIERASEVEEGSKWASERVREERGRSKGLFNGEEPRRRCRGRRKRTRWWRWWSVRFFISSLAPFLSAFGTLHGFCRWRRKFKHTPSKIQNFIEALSKSKILFMVRTDDPTRCSRASSHLARN